MVLNFQRNTVYDTAVSHSRGKVFLKYVIQLEPFLIFYFSKYKIFMIRCDNNLHI